jgi:hypothetical protein
MCNQDRKGTMTETMQNLRQPMSRRRKLKLFLRNNWTKARTRSDCCGNHGEPGC